MAWANQFPSPGGTCLGGRASRDCELITTSIRVYDSTNELGEHLIRPVVSIGQVDIDGSATLTVASWCQASLTSSETTCRDKYEWRCRKKKLGWQPIGEDDPKHTRPTHTFVLRQPYFSGRHIPDAEPMPLPDYLRHDGANPSSTAQSRRRAISVDSKRQGNG